MNNISVFGRNPEENIVAVEIACGAKAGEPCQAVLYSRRDNKIIRRVEPFMPFLVVEDERLLKGLSAQYSSQPLRGKGSLKAKVSFNSLAEWELAKKWLLNKTSFSAGVPNAPFIILNDLLHQYLLTSGRTLFKGMKFEDVRRMQVDIETHTSPGFEFCNPAREGDRIIIIAMSDSTGWQEIIVDKSGDEKGLLRRFVKLVRERDPDVIEGHNIFKFDLPYISTRAARHGVKLSLGRDGGRMHLRPSRFVLGERMISFTKYEIFGRHIIDTYFLLQAYDLAHRSLESLNLKEAAIHFGLAARNRVYIDGGNISREFERDPDRVARYAQDDIKETAALSNLLSRTWFVQAQILPFSYQNVCLRGNAAKIDALILREYLYQSVALPYPDRGRKFEGGYTDIFKEGVIHNVHHCDVSSLYPSIMLARKIAPASDSLGVFLQMLSYFREYRLDAKEKMRRSKTAAKKHYYDVLQSAFKILINSFYGYLGCVQARFNDFNAAELITAEGRSIVKNILLFLEKHGAKPIEADTDGIYFVPPVFKSAKENDSFREKLVASLPPGIDLEFDGEYQAMFSYKMKNYALLAKNGEIIIKGAALKSRGLEPFLRSFLREYLRLKLKSKDAEGKNIHALKSSYGEKIAKGSFPITHLAKTETLKDSPATYSAKITKGGRGRNAAYELALRSDRAYEAGDQVSYYITGTKKNVAMHETARMVSDWNPKKRDENIAYYTAKLDALYRRLQSGAGFSSGKDGDE